ncbi:TrlF family AAA-like ATPase [Brevibacillus laterosporus]|uniref:TrlF family AAA-like ATPase n=1 Tax=Brevibacillus laterosporus TaxID=1465 RepID=UPI003D1FCBAB
MDINGAKWWKFDFHTHTPASYDYGKGDHALQSLTPKQWLLNVMSKEIDCVAVTDHNSGAWIDILKSELKDMEQHNIEGYRPLTIFPGVEITVHTGIHLLAIFDPDKTSETIIELLGACDYDGTKGNSDGCTRKSFSEVVEEITKRKGIAIPAHVDQPSGLFVVHEGNTLRSSLQVNGLLAIQICDNSFNKPQIYNESKLNLSEVAGSDSHHPDQLGTSFTWVKMEKPDINALKLALHDGDDGVIRFDNCPQNPNDLNNRFFIKNIEIIHAAKAGRGEPLKIPFSPWLNTIIGGRGSGKSSIIEFLRLILDQKDNLPDKLKTDFEKFAQISEGRGKQGMLTDNTEIRVEMRKDGRDIALIWKNNLIKEEHRNIQGEWEKQEQSNIIGKRFPVRMFSQKQLFELTNEPKSLIHLVDGKLDKLSWEETMDELANSWFESRRKEREINLKLKNKSNIKLQLQDTLAKIHIFEASGHKDLLSGYRQVQNISNEIDEMLNNFKEIRDSLSNIVPTMDLPNISEVLCKGLDENSLMIIHNKLSEFAQLRIKMESINNEIKSYVDQFEKDLKQIPFSVKKDETIHKYEKLVERLQEAGEKNPEAYGKLVSLKEELEAKIKETDAIETELESQKHESKRLYQEIVQHQKKLREDRSKIIERWNASNENIRLSLDEMGDIGQGEASFRELIRRPGKEFTKDLCDRDKNDNPQGGFFNDLLSKSDEERWSFRETFIKQIVQGKETSSNFSKPFLKHIQNISTNTPEDIDRICTWFPEDKTILKLFKEGREEDIETGSAGQRTAAMLSLLLLLDDSPLIIDQPEDDLDTKRITDLVVTGLRTFKAKQQIIVVTHNPNIPVNGGAENIIQMNYARGLIRTLAHGALQKNEVREAVCDVMEGGRTALTNRYFRISKALQ